VSHSYRQATPNSTPETSLNLLVDGIDPWSEMDLIDRDSGSAMSPSEAFGFNRVSGCRAGQK
jgi:hypothetical protein